MFASDAVALYFTIQIWFVLGNICASTEASDRQTQTQSKAKIIPTSFIFVLTQLVPTTEQRCGAISEKAKPNISKPAECISEA